MRGGRLALVVPTALLAITAMVSPSFADDVTPEDGGETPAVTETPVPSAEPDPAPAADPSPAADPEPAADEAPEPKSGSQHSAPTPGAAFTDGDRSEPSGDEPVLAAAKDKDEDDEDEDEDDDNEKKVVVCKYVITPGGVLDHIIIPSASTLKDWDGVTFPYSFPDAHDSVAIRFQKVVDGKKEKAKDVPLSDCPTNDALVPPTVEIDDPCGADNAAYRDIPKGPYTVVRGLDGSFTLKADLFHFFIGDVTEVFYPAPAETNTEACIEDEDEDKVVVCKYVGTPPGVPDHIIVVSKSSALNQGWVEGQFPGPFADAHDSVAIRWAIGNEQPGDEELVNCPVEIEAPELTSADPCGTGNASYGDVPLSDGYEIDHNDDGSITLTALGNRTFAGGEKTFTYPAIEEENTEACPVVDDTRVVLCVYPTTAPATAPATARAAEVLGTIVILDLADVVAQGFAGIFPFEFADEETISTAIRYANEGEVADDIEGLTCGVAGEVEEQDPEVPGEVGGIAETAALPNTGGPAGYLVPLGAGLVMAGAALILARRREMV